MHLLHVHLLRHHVPVTFLSSWGSTEAATGVTTTFNWLRPQAVCYGAFHSLHSAEPEGNPIKLPPIKVNQTWTGAAVCHQI